MKKKLFVLLSLLGLLVVVSVMTVKKVKRINTAEATDKVERVEQVSSTETSVKKEDTSKKKSIFEEEQVVKEEVYPKLRIDGTELKEDALPKGTVVSVKEVAGNNQWVEIISNPKKGFIEKEVLEPRQGHIDTRESKRANRLSKAEFKESLDKELATFLNQKGGQVSIYLETVDHQFSYSHDGDKVNRTASSIKLPFISYVMTLADNKKIDLDTTLTFTENYRMDGTGIIQFEPAGKVYTIKELAELVIRYSDNVAYIMLLNYIGEPNFIQFLGELDSNSPNNRVFSTPHILTKSMAYVYENKDKSDNMMLLYKWIQDSTFDDGVAVGLPGVDVAHKTGWMPMYAVSNDISLVKDEKQPYYLTIMTNGYDDSYSEQAIADLAEIIDAHMLQRQYD